MCAVCGHLNCGDQICSVCGLSLIDPVEIWNKKQNGKQKSQKQIQPENLQEKPLSKAERKVQGKQVANR
jgi:hypothetical protein